MGQDCRVSSCKISTCVQSSHRFANWSTSSLHVISPFDSHDARGRQWLLHTHASQPHPILAGEVEGLQAAWLLLRHCACPRANYLFRALPPTSTADLQARMTKPSPFVWRRSSALRMPRCPPCNNEPLASRSASADWVSAKQLLTGFLDGHAASHPHVRPGYCGPTPCPSSRPQRWARAIFNGSGASRHHLRTQGFEAPGWGEALEDHADPTDREDETGRFLRGWQHRAARACDERALETHLFFPCVSSVAAVTSWAPCGASMRECSLSSQRGTGSPCPAHSSASCSPPAALAAAARPQPLFLPPRARCAWGPPCGLRHVRCPCISGLALGARHRPCL